MSKKTSLSKPSKPSVRSAPIFDDHFPESFEGCVDLGERLLRAGIRVLWRLADLALHVQTSHGGQELQRWAEEVRMRAHRKEFTYHTARKYRWVATQYQNENRFSNLTFKHHIVAAPQEKRLELLKLAEKNEWSAGALSRHIKQLQPSDYPPWLCYTDVWNIPDCDERFGIPYPGRIPGQIVQNLLYYYTEPGALIVDPMAGGGVTLDVCKAMDRRCIAFDLAPHAERRDILGADALEPWPVTEPVDLVFMDPPYWSQQEDAYGGVARAATHEDFLTDLLAVMHRGREHLKPGGLFAVLLAPMAIKTEYQDSPIELVAGATRMGWKLVRRFSVPVSSQQVGPQVVADCKAKKVPVALIRDLLIFQVG